MPTSIKINDQVYRIGDRLMANSGAESREICTTGEVVEIFTIHGDMIGLRSSRRLRGWGSLEGTVPSKQGYWASRDCIFDNFESIDEEYLVVATVRHKNKDLKGMKCKVISRAFSGQHAFIELEENVGGGSADGLGKAGHCVLVSSDAVRKVGKTKTADKK